MKEERKKIFLGYIKLIIITLVVTNVVLYIVAPSKVIGKSMEPKLQDGDYVLLLKQAYLFSTPNYNDLVVIDYNPDSLDVRYIVKRVIGLPGDELVFKDCKLYRNGELLEEDYIKEAMIDQPNQTIIIPEGKVYVLGDNRNYSVDSRHFGYIDIDDHIVGKVLFKLF